MRKGMKLVVTVCVIVSMLLGNVTFCQASTLHSRDEAVNWANSQKEQSLDYDRVYGAQCVDLIKYYYDYLGSASYARGNACDYASNALPPGWSRVYSGYQPGDIAVWKVNHKCSTCSTSSFGHVGIITSADSVGFNAVNQNFNGQSYCTVNWFNISALQCAIRPDFSAAPTPVASISYGKVSTEFVDTWNAGLYGEINNPSKLSVSAVGAYIWDSKGNLVVNHSENCSLTTSVVYQRLNVVGEALPTGLRSGETYTYQLFAEANGQTCYSEKKNFTIVDDQKPVISDIKVYDVDSEGYTVSCVVTDNFEVDRVQFPSWTVINDQDDNVVDWGSNTACRGTRDGNTYTFRVKRSEHNNEYGFYRTHIYAYDKAGNSVSARVEDINIEKIVPTETPLPTVTPEATVEPTPTQKVTATPEATVEPTPTQKVTATPEATVEPTPKVTATPEATVKPTPTQKVTATPEATVEPTPTQKVTATPEATVEPIPTQKVTATPEATVEPTPTQKVAATPEATVEPIPTMEATATPEVTEKPTVTPAPTQKPNTVSKPAKVKLKSVKAMGKKKLKVTWDKNSGVSGYQIQYALNANFTKEKKTKSAGKYDETKTLTGLKIKKYYYVRVRAYKKSEDKTVYGSWSSVKKCKVK